MDKLEKELQEEYNLWLETQDDLYEKDIDRSKVWIEARKRTLTEEKPVISNYDLTRLGYNLRQDFTEVLGIAVKSETINDLITLVLTDEICRPEITEAYEKLEQTNYNKGF